MMMKQMTASHSTIGDAAVDGLLGGVIAGMAMAAYLVIANLIAGEGIAVLARFDPDRVSPLIGTLLHLAVSGVYGALFGIVWKYVRRLNVPALFIGAGYGIALFIFAQSVLLPGSRSPLAEISFVHFGLAHIIYGLVLGWSIRRNSKS